MNWIQKHGEAALIRAENAPGTHEYAYVSYGTWFWLMVYKWYLRFAKWRLKRENRELEKKLGDQG